MTQLVLICGALQGLQQSEEQKRPHEISPAARRGAKKTKTGTQDGSDGTVSGQNQFERPSAPHVETRSSCRTVPSDQYSSNNPRHV